MMTDIFGIIIKKMQLNTMDGFDEFQSFHQLS